MSKYALVAIGYNRPDSMERLLESLKAAEYDNDNVTLIISIDNSGNDDVEKYVKGFEWPYGDKIIRTFKERQGLRKHILKCGEYVNEYDAIAVFEDDVVAAPGFYMYMKAAVEKYADDDRVAGISLYNHLWNVNAKMPFQPAYSKYDVYFLQFAQSWGQIWMRDQWLAFSEWYSKNNGKLEPQDTLPSFVTNWPETSWLKYHIKYCVDMNKYFVYPYKALTTCYSDIGQHNTVKNNITQIPFLEDVKRNYDLPDIDDAIKYDVFFERVLTGKEINGISSDEICFDFYGSKNTYSGYRYVVTIKYLPYKLVNSYSLELRPQEANVIKEIPGDEIFLYDTSESAPTIKGNNDIKYFAYAFRLFNKGNNMVDYIIDRVKNRFRRIMKSSR